MFLGNRKIFIMIIIYATLYTFGFPYIILTIIIRGYDIQVCFIDFKFLLYSKYLHPDLHL